MEIQLAPASPAATYTLVFVMALLLSTALAAGYIAWLAARGTAQLGQDGMDIRVPFYGRRIELADLDLAGAVSVEDIKGSEFKPSMRTNGVGLPGYQVGWFRLSNGDSALVALGAGNRAVAIPVRSGFTLLLGVDSPSEVLAQLKAFGGK